jgi:hypothetical protein
MSTALLDRQVAIRVDDTNRWTIVGEAAALSVAERLGETLSPDVGDLAAPSVAEQLGEALSPEQRLSLLKARARRRAATRPWYHDSAEMEQDTHETVVAAMPLQLKVIAHLDD